MRRVDRLLRSFDRVQQRSRWLGFPFAVRRKFNDDNGAALTWWSPTTRSSRYFPLPLVMVTLLGFLLGRDSGFQQRLVGSAVAEFPIIGDQVRDNIHGLRGRGVGLVVGLVAFALGARGLIQVAQHAMAENWNIPSRQRPSSSMRARLAARVPAHGSGNPKRCSRWRPPAPNRSAAGPINQSREAHHSARLHHSP